MHKITELQAQVTAEEVYRTSRNEFYINQTDYNNFMADTKYKVFAIVVEASPQHPFGIYKIPKIRLQRLINSWVNGGDIDWTQNKKHSDSNVPAYLRNEWFPKKR